MKILNLESESLPPTQIEAFFMKNKAYHNRVFYYRDQVIGWLSLRFPEIDWANVASGLPEVVWRNRWEHFAEIYGLPYSRKYLQNLDSEGCGPAAFKLEKKGDRIN